MKICTPASTCVVTVNYKNSDMTLRCIEALLQLEDAPGAIVVVDNGSGSHSTDILWNGWQLLADRYHRGRPVSCLAEDAFPAEGDVFLPLNENGGFSAGNNAALRRLLTTRSQYNAFWLLNNDAFPQNGALVALCAEDAPLVGSTIVYDANPNQVQCAAGGVISSYTGATRFLHGRDLVRNILDANVEEVNRKLDYINGASLFIHRDIFTSIGLLPEEYFLYYEDLDFCTNAKQAGFKLAWAQQSIVRHADGGSSEQGKNGAKNKTIEYYSIRNRILFIHKYFKLYFALAVCGAFGSICLRIKYGYWENIPIIFRAICDAIRGVYKK